MGAGVAVLPSLYAVSEARRDPDLVVRRIDHKTARRSLALVWRDTSPLEPMLQRLATELKSTASTLLEDK